MSVSNVGGKFRTSRGIDASAGNYANRKDDRLVTAETHLVEIALPRNYPRVPPQCRMLTPVFHPNIAPHAIGIGDHWSAGESLASFIARIGALIAYQSYNTKSPLNGEAARWTSENLDRLPLDPVSRMIEEAPRPAPPPPPSPPPATPDVSAPLAVPVDVLKVRCAQCGAVLHVPTRLRGKKFRCPRCQAMDTVPAGGRRR